MKYILIHRKKIIILGCILCFFIFVNLGFASNLGDAFSNPNFLQGAAEQAGYDSTTGTDRVGTVISNIIQTALTFLGVIFLILMIYGGYMWMTARGNEEQSGKAKNTIVAAIIGIVIVLSAYAISYLVIEKLGSKALDSSNSTIEAIEIIN